MTRPQDHHHHRQGPRAAVLQGPARAVVHGDRTARRARPASIAQSIEEELREHDETQDHPRSGCARSRLEHLRALGGREVRRRATCKLRDVSPLDRPLIVLIGGTTGVGKSTIATEVAHRLGHQPHLVDGFHPGGHAWYIHQGPHARDYESAFNAWRGLRVPVPQGANPVIVGFREQTAVVSTGIKALIKRAVLEGMSMVIEGIHLVPGYLDPRKFGNARVVQLVIGVDDEESHLSHFYIREVQTDGNRPHARYRDELRQHPDCSGSYIEDLAREHDIPVIYSHQLDRTVAEVLEHVVATAHGRRSSAGRAGTTDKVGGQAT